MLSIIAISDIVLISVAIAWIAAACITDLRRREVPNWLSFSLIAAALAIRGAAALLASQPLYFFYGLVALALFFGLANALYYGRVFGGGDAKLLMALAPALATTPLFAKPLFANPALYAEPFLLTFSINIFVLGFIYGLVFSIASATKNKKAFSSKFKKVHKRTKKPRLWIWSAAVAVLAVSFFIASLLPLLLALFVILFVLPLLYCFVKAVEDTSMIKAVKPAKLAEGDWLVRPVKAKHRLIKPSVHGLSSEEIALLKRTNKNIMIKVGLPFVPIFLVSLVCSLLLGNLLLRFILLFI